MTKTIVFMKINKRQHSNNVYCNCQHNNTKGNNYMQKKFLFLGHLVTVTKLSTFNI